MSATHEHKWRGHMNLDGCHNYSNLYSCTCGAALSVSGERQFFSRGRAQPGIYMADETGKCERCRELMAGARRRPTIKRIQKTQNSNWVRILRDGREVP